MLKRTGQNYRENGVLRGFRSTVAAELLVPIPLDNLEVWLKADAITGYANGAEITSWADSSGNGRNATQSNFDQYPLYIASGLNSKPTVRFDGMDDYLDLGDLSGAFPSAATLFVVATINANQNYSLYDTHNHTPYWYYSFTSQGYIGVFRSPRLENHPAAPPSSGSHIFTVKSSASTYEVFFDGVSQGAQTAAYSAGTYHRLGMPASSNAVLNGDISEVIVYSTALSGGSIAQVEAYLEAKYNL